MAQTNFEMTGEKASSAMLEGLTSMIRKELRARIMERIEPDVQAAVDGALEAFKTTIESYRDHANMRDTVRVLIERRDIAVTNGERDAV